MQYIELTTNEKIKVYPDTTSINDIIGGAFDKCGRIMVELSPDGMKLKPTVDGAFNPTKKDTVIDFCCDDFALVNENIKKYNALADLVGVKGYYGNLVLYVAYKTDYGLYTYDGRGFTDEEAKYFANALNKLADERADYIKELHSKYDNMSSGDRRRRVDELTPKDTRLEQFLKEHPEFQVFQM